MALLDRIIYLDFKLFFTFSTFAVNKNALTLRLVVKVYGHLITAIGTFNLYSVVHMLF